MHKTNIIRIALVTAVILLVPFVAMQFTQEVNWTLSDFIIMGAALFGVGLAYELLAKRSQSTVYRAALGVGLLGAFLLFWISGAVGIIGSENQPANLLYGAVFVVGLVGFLLARFQPRGMAVTLFAAAAVQFFVPIVALIVWPDVSWGAAGMARVFMLNSFFVSLFAGSGILFLRVRPFER